MGELKVNKSANKGQALFDFAFIKKLKEVKNIEVVIACVLGAVILLIYFSSLGGSSSSTSQASFNSHTEYTTSVEYAKSLEQKLSQTLSSIAGAGRVQVMVTLESGPELVIATSSDHKTNISRSGDNKTESITVVENPIIINQGGTSKPLVLMEILPTVKGVLVVAQGASDVRVRLDLLNAVQGLFGISGNNIQIFVSN